jgi:cytochrome c553
MNKLILIPLLSVLVSSSYAFDNIIELGEQLYINQCVLCHGNEGFDLSSPVIAGLKEDYIISQLNAFKPEGTRTDELMFVMNDWAAGLNDQEIESLAKYISGLNSCDVIVPRSITAGNLLNGKRLSEERACLECHLKSNFKIQGQKGSYLLYALDSFQNGQRKNVVMEAAVEGLAQSDIADLAKYFSSINTCQ